MTLRNEQEAINTRAKLAKLEELIANAKARAETPVRDLSIRSLARLANQLKEELIRYEIQARASSENRQSA
jgi:hypothetical protein